MRVQVPHGDHFVMADAEAAMSNCKERCDACRWWVFDETGVSDEYERVGCCHRYPPPNSDEDVDGFPSTFDFNWCGEWARGDPVPED